MTETMAGPSAKRGKMMAEIPDGSPIHGVLEWPAHPSGLVLVLDACPGTAPSETAGTLATELRQAGLGTLIVNLMSDVLEGSFIPSAVPMLAERVRHIAAWVGDQPLMAGIPLGFLGVNDAAPAALAAASAHDCAEAVVIWAGEPDPTSDALAGITAPTLLLVRAQDEKELGPLRRGLARFGGIKKLVGITERGPTRTGAGMLTEAARWAAVWFVHYLAMERTWRGSRAPGPRALSGAS